MNQTSIASNQEWLKVLGKGMVTLPKKWRDELGIENGAVVKAKKEGNTIVLETAYPKTAPYRVYTKAEIEEFVKEDRLSHKLARDVQRHLSTV